MASLSNQPSNPNALVQHSARLVLKRAPNLSFFAQDVEIPGMTGGVANFQTELDVVPWPGETFQREDFQISFKVDEDLKNYLEVHNWLLGIYYPDSHSQYAALSKISRSDKMLGTGVFSDMTAIIYDSARRPKFEVRFQDAFPRAMSGLRFTTRNDTVEPLDVTVAFRYRHFTIHSTADGT